MKKSYLIFLCLLIGFTSCKKKSNDSNNAGWTEADWTFYNNVLVLQDKAGENWDTWSQTMDSLEAISKLQEFFLNDPSVSSATIGSQGIAVRYTNGMGGGIFLNPQDDPGAGSQKAAPIIKIPSSELNPKSLVNIKKVILLNPHYWERSNITDWIIQHYNYWLPNVGFTLQTILKNQAANVDAFTQLSGYGIIHIYSHGWAWPDEKNIEEVYIKTGEVANQVTTAKYQADIKNRNVIILLRKISNSKNAEVYGISEKFIAAHNDFSKDTVLFYGGFCYSLLGGWDQLPQKFAKGSYLGFNWAVWTNKNADWAVSLVDSLCDTLARPPYNPEKWITGSNPPKSYYDPVEKKTVTVQYVGDGSLTLWEGAKAGTVTDIDGNVYHTVIIGTQEWMVENLKTTRLNDGTSLPLVMIDSVWALLTTPGYCWYKNDVTYKNIYGAVYNGFTVSTGKLAPVGWHVPTNVDWDILTTYLGGELVAGGKLKETGTTHWKNPNTGATNESGFTAVPSESRSGMGGFFVNGDGAGAGWYTSSEVQGISFQLWSRSLAYFNTRIYSSYGINQDGEAVRCIRDK